MNNKRWELKNNYSEETVSSLSKQLNINEALARVLVLRNINTFEQAKHFFRPELNNLHDPFLMNGMDVAVKRVIKSLTENEKILIYGDYDVDGTNAAAMVYLFLKKLGGTVSIYIPNRLKEGYGISLAGIDEAEASGCSLLISVDCGITAIEEVEYARKKKIDIIICDHHQPADKIPNALAVLDPIKGNCNYPFKHLSGCGVAFKLIQGICNSIGMKTEAYNYLDFVAVAAAADIVYLTDENRILVKYGLELLNTSTRPGFLALIKKAGFKPGSINCSNIVFGLAPRINAVGRLGDAQRAINLLIAENYEQAEEYADILENENRKRKNIDEKTFQEAEEYIQNNINLDERISIVVSKDDWHPGVIGIVASRVVEKYYRPTIMLTKIEGVLKGSARSIAGFNIFEALKKCEHLLIQYGGHQAAAGLSLAEENFEKFKEEFEKIAASELDNYKIIPTIFIDSEVNLSEIKPKFIRILEQIAPFGPNNMRPVFLTKNVNIFSFPRVVGNNHLIMKLKQPGSPVFDAVGYDMGDAINTFENLNDNVDIVFSIETVNKEGYFIPQIRLKDIRKSTLNKE